MIFGHVAGDEGVVNIAVQGTVSNIAAELSIMIHHIYKEIAEKSESDADDFKTYIRSTVDEDFLFQKKSEDLIPSVKKATLKRILDELTELIDDDVLKDMLNEEAEKEKFE